MSTCSDPVTCTTDCLFTGTPCTPVRKLHAPTLVAAVAVLVIFAAPVVAVVWMLVGGATAHTGAAVLPRCVTEDSRDCYWNAGESGNGAGESFVDVGGVTFYGVER